LVSLRERIAAGTFGQLARVGCFHWDEAPPNPIFRSQSGGIAVDMGVHDFDQMRWLVGQDVLSLLAIGSRTASAGTAREDPDSAEFICLLSGGAVGTISLGRRFPAGDSCWVEVMGDLRYERDEFMWGHEGAEVFHAAVVAQIDAFASVVGGGRQVGATGEDALWAIRSAEVAAQALRGSVVQGDQ
jgi:myo-inositol 2-dehydrogenase/D-chiro-inositol 1-dehydrogenase